MSAVNILRQSDAVHILTDGLAISGEGDDNALPKAHGLAHINAAVAVRGTLVAEVLLLPIIRAHKSYDALKQNIGPVLRDCFDRFGEVVDQVPGTGNGRDTDLFIAGWTDAGEPDCFLVTNHTRYPDAIPFEPMAIGGLMSVPHPPELTDEFWESVRTRNPLAASWDDVDAAIDGLSLLELQRGYIFDPGNGSERSTVGAFAQLTTVRRDEITTRILRRW